MKRILRFVLLSIIILSTSCSDDKGKLDYDLMPDRFPELSPSEVIDSLKLTGIYADINGYNGENYTTRLCYDYENTYFELRVEYKGIRASDIGEEELYCMKAMAELGKEYTTPAMEKSYREYSHGGRPYIMFLTSYINGKVTMTCDKKLFGQEAGTDISSHFSLYYSSNPCMMCGVIGEEMPRMQYEWGEEMPTELDKFFLKGSWLQKEYLMKFRDIPEEKYDELTMTINFPLKDAKWYEYFRDKYRGNTPELKIEERSMSAKCKLTFIWL